MAVPLLSLERMLEVLECLYSDLLGAQYGARLLECLNAALGSTVTRIHTFDRASGAVLAWHCSDAAYDRANDAYVRHWGARDPAPRELARAPSGTVLRFDELFDGAYVQRSDFYQDFLLPLGLRWRMAGVLHAGHGLSTVVAGVRHPELPPYDPLSANLLARLLPHFQQAARVREQLRSAFAASAPDLPAFLEHLETACFIADGEARVAFANSAAMSGFDELPVQLIGSFLRFLGADAQTQWLTSLNVARQTRGAASFELPTGAGHRWEIQIISWRAITPAPQVAEDNLFLVTMRRTAHAGSADMQALAATTRLTRAEAEVLRLLIGGASTKDIALRRRTSVHTVRSQVNAILGKTGCASMPELIGKLHRANP